MIYYVFLVQEEMELRGAITSRFFVEPDIGIAIYVTDTGDTPGKKNQMPLSLGFGACIKIMDTSLISSRELVRDLELSAKDIKFQREILTFGELMQEQCKKVRQGICALELACSYEVYTLSS